MKLSVSLSAEDVEFLDSYADAHAEPSRSAVLRRAIVALRTRELPGAYEDAWDEWHAGGEQQIWERTTADGLG